MASDINKNTVIWALGLTVSPFLGGMAALEWFNQTIDTEVKNGINNYIQNMSNEQAKELTEKLENEIIKIINSADTHNLSTKEDLKKVFNEVFICRGSYWT